MPLYKVIDSTIHLIVLYKKYKVRAEWFATILRNLHTLKFTHLTRDYFILWKSNIRYLLTCKVSIYCILDFLG